MIEQYNVVSPFQILDNDAQARQNNEHLAKVLYQKICSGDKSVQHILIMPDMKQRGYVITIEREACQ